MASYKGTVILSGMISPTDTTDAYPTHEDILGKGGYSSVADLTARDNISTLRRKSGMMVYVESDGKTYQLQGGVDNSNWTEFTSGNGDSTTETLEITTISVSGIINTIFAGITIADGEILYVRGNDGIIDTNVFSGTLSTVLINNVYNDFIIKYDGDSSVVYVNNTVDESHVQIAIGEYPIGYDVIDLTNNTISAKISTLLTETYTSALQVYTYEGIMSTVEKEDNSFTALNKNKEFVVMYDGSTFTAYKKEKVTISDLQTRMVLN
jgi:hypothetical protein